MRCHLHRLVASLSFLGAGLVLAALAGGLGCEPQTAPLVSRGFPIINGSNDSRWSHKAVVAVENSQRESLCTGTLVTPRVVLTAAHCTYGARSEDLKVSFCDDLAFPIQVSVSEVLTHPQYSSSTLINDIAVLRMAAAPPVDIWPIPHLPESMALSSTDIGRQIENVGFGRDEDGKIGVKVSIYNNLELICTEPGGCQASDYTTLPNTICHSQDYGGTCSGDSGGPALVFTEREYVAGITSFGDPRCEDYGCGTKVDAFQGFIEEFAYRSGELGATCESGSDCHSGFCADSVCCDTACTESDLACNWPNQRGACSQENLMDDLGCRCNSGAHPWPGLLGAGYLLLWLCFKHLRRLRRIYS